MQAALDHAKTLTGPGGAKTTVFDTEGEILMTVRFGIDPRKPHQPS